MNIQIKNNSVSLNDLEELCKELNKQNKEKEKHFKGYMFDSLVYRYKLARHRMTEMEMVEERNSGVHKHDAQYYRQNEERDVMRFIQILDEAIGEHD